MVGWPAILEAFNLRLQQESSSLLVCCSRSLSAPLSILMRLHAKRESDIIFVRRAVKVK